MRRRRNQGYLRRGVPQPCNKLRYFDWRQLSPLARFRSLRHLDLEFFSTHQVFCRHSKTGRGHLFYLTTDRVTVHVFMVPVWIFSTFSSIVAPPNAVHRGCNGAVRLGTQRADGHSRSDKTRAYRLHRFNLFQWNGGSFRKGKKIAQCGWGTLVDHAGEALVVFAFTTQRCLL